MNEMLVKWKQKVTKMKMLKQITQKIVPEKSA